MTGAFPGAAWVVRRLLFAIPVVAGITTLTFVLIHLAPGDPVYLLAGDGGSPAYYADMRAKYGLDRPLPEQFLRYAGAILTADLGHSFMFQAPVARVLLDHAPASLLLGGTALLLATGLGGAAGFLCVLWPSRILDAFVRAGSSVIYAAPVFWTGQLFVLVAAVKLGLLPAGGLRSARESLTGLPAALDVGWHLILPALTLALPFAAIVARVSRASLIEALQEPYVDALFARGFSRLRVVARHAGANALVPVVALVGQHAGQILAGAALTEALFAWPGIGYLVLHASAHRDYPLVTAAFILISSSVVFFNVIADAAGAWLDPRARL